MKTWPISITALLIPLAVSAQETVSVKDVKLGEHWYGPQLATDDLKGRVFLLEFWGIN